MSDPLPASLLVKIQMKLSSPRVSGVLQHSRLKNVLNFQICSKDYLPTQRRRHLFKHVQTLALQKTSTRHAPTKYRMGLHGSKRGGGWGQSLSPRF